MQEIRAPKVKIIYLGQAGLLFEWDRIFETATENNIQMKLYRLCDELEFGRRSPHKLRKTYISLLLNNGLDPDFVRRQAGHRQLQTTLNNYTYSTTRDEENVERLNQLLAL